MSINLDANTIKNGAETLKNVSRIAANLTNPAQNHPQEKKLENMNQPHTQTVEVKVGDTNPQQKPQVVHEKKETHIHKAFPDQRELTERECQVKELELRNEHEYRMQELKFRMLIDEQDRRDRKEREERRRAQERRFARNMGIGFTVAGIVAVGCIAADFYTNTWLPKHGGMALPAQQVEISGEGTVK